MFPFKIPSSHDVIETRRLKVHEQNLLTDRKKVADGSAINEVLRGCIVTPGYDPLKLLVGDRLALLVHLRVITHGPEYYFRVTCPQCGHGFTWKEQLDQLHVQYLDPPLKYGEERTWDVVLPVAQKRVTMRLLRGEDERMMREVQTSKDRPYSGLLRLLTVQVEGERVLPASWFDDLDAADWDYMMASWREHDCGVETSIEVTCPQCDWVFEIELPIAERGFFAPKVTQISWRGRSPGKSSSDRSPD